MIGYHALHATRTPHGSAMLEPAQAGSGGRGPPTARDSRGQGSPGEVTYPADGERVEHEQRDTWLGLGSGLEYSMAVPG
eukprot:scaffold130071_cov51-Phaeocystis_antarctica.AAC.1